MSHIHWRKYFYVISAWHTPAQRRSGEPDRRPAGPGLGVSTLTLPPGEITKKIINEMKSTTQIHIRVSCQPCPYLSLARTLSRHLRIDRQFGKLSRSSNSNCRCPLCPLWPPPRIFETYRSWSDNLCKYEQPFHIANPVSAHYFFSSNLFDGRYICICVYISCADVEKVLRTLINMEAASEYCFCCSKISPLSINSCLSSSSLASRMPCLQGEFHLFKVVQNHVIYNSLTGCFQVVSCNEPPPY